MDAMPEYSLFFVRILEELDTKYSTVSYQDLCKSLCARFDLVHLAKLRSLLFYTACLDPAFPATLFKDKMRCSLEDQQSKKLMVAADIVTMFNLIQMNGGIAKDKLPMGQRPKFHKNQSFESCRSDTDVYKFNKNDRPYNLLDTRGHHVSRNSPCPKSDSNDCQQFIPSSDPNFLLGVTKDLKCRAASLDKLQHLPQYSSVSPPQCEMQSTYFPMDIDSESTTDQESLHINPGSKDVFMSSGEPFTVHSCVQKLNTFKEDFHNLVAFSPHVITTECKANSKAGGDYHRRELNKTPTFFNHSFELPYSNPYFEPMSSPIQNKGRVKHESLDDLQASTYFGPTTVSEFVSSRRASSKHGKQPAWPVKSLSLNNEEGPDYERPFLKSKGATDNHRYNISTMDNDKQFQFAKEKPTASPSGFSKKTNGTKTKDMNSVVCGPSVERREVGKRYKDKSINCPSFQTVNVDNGMSVGTQTEQTEHKKDYTNHNKYGERPPFKHSDEDSEIISDDISDIFRFLDDMSVCDSVGVVQSSCYNSNGSLFQVAKSDGDSSPEHDTIKLGKTGIKLDRLFQSLESSDDELKQSVCKLVLRIGEIEKKLESLSGVRGEISQVLSKLTKLDEKIQEPETNGKMSDNGIVEQNKTDMNLSTHVFQCNTTGHNMKVEKNSEWCCSEVEGSESLRVKALKKNMSTRRSSRSLTEENSATESKVASITNSPRDWRTVSYSSHKGEEGKERERHNEGKDRHRKPRETDRQYDAHQAHRSSKLPKDSYLVEQVFSPHHFPPAVKSHVKGSPLYTDLRLTSLADGKRSQPSWTIEEYKRNSGDKSKLSPLDLQVQESLNPNNLEYWMEDIYTPGYDSLLKRKEAEFRRAKACKIGALIVAAACTVILVIVVPICTMKS
ncbi:major intrinsically disordered Notch2-binding receptor 1 [Xyrauchen texanus]|uniref:major intrinsically disordered Notch2-binding receptor 1 n=1 Tax=Xyrauchen texanus TaxID=154827 RepID=UPI002241D39E|nr:major intrinsically disordered Notch2-binding receptor 1 [Xyrauchen texanus]